MLEIGLKFSTETVVTEEMTAAAMKSGLVPVLATPILVALVENTCLESPPPIWRKGRPQWVLRSMFPTMRPRRWA